ncbi:MAG: paraquat-inducible protein A [Gammaproteobacteria bacterium]
MPEPDHRNVLIRVLVVASLGLLLAGSVTPLLTTERFYFFSNTFSLASGLRQLVANQQMPIAFVIGLFSLCVPVVKACVIWLAASEAPPGGRLLTLADRFGKWSMLEVFIAALVIVALKLGPVVDARLHYGAYLLAGSVLVSGIASQLLVHERHPGPLFSGPVTLTVGAVAGAVAATLLLGLLNPGFIRLEALIGTPESRCIQRVLQLDRVYATASNSEADYASALRGIEAGACPEDFRGTFADYIEAWEQLAAQPADADAEPGWLGRAGRRLGLIATRDDTLEEIERSWAELSRLALEHGVTAPPR